MNRFWDSIIYPILCLENAKVIVEIGSNTGENTQKILDYVKKVGGKLYSIDPVPQFPYDEWEANSEGKFVMYKELSLSVIPLIKDADVFLIDGDHNWYTVYNELNAIKATYDGEKFPLILFHDVSWPYAYRDLYYNPVTIPDIYRFPYEKKGIRPDSVSLVENGEGINAHLNNAIYTNNPRNGVRTAIEDFIAENDVLHLKFYTINALNGIGLLVEEKKHEAITEFFYSEETLKNVIRTVENDRIFKMIKLERAKKIICEVKEKTKKYELTNTDLNNILEKEKVKNKILMEKIKYTEERLAEEKKKNLEIIKEHEKKQEYLKSEILKSKEDANRWEQTSEYYRKEAAEHFNSFRYRIGTVMVESYGSLRKMIRLPLILKNILNEYKTKDIENSKSEIKTKESPKKEDRRDLGGANKESAVNVLCELNTVSFREYHLSDIENDLKKILETKVSIIIPIYNAYEELCECLESIIRNTDFPYELILINDCSSDLRISQILSKYKECLNVVIYDNDSNLGFVKTINYGIKHTTNDIVLLNSDTKVTKGWLRKLVFAAYHKENIATVTPFSNAAGAFSVPIMGENNDLPVGFTLEEMNRIVERSSKLDYLNVPTGNGFCMYVRRSAIESVGLFDSDTFSRGYGEENDFCMRAKQKGLSNIICDDLYIYHKRSASFKEEKLELIEKNRKILDERYPLYNEEIKVFKNNERLIDERKKIANMMYSENRAAFTNKRILFVLHEGGGGTVKTNEDLMLYITQKDYEVFMLTSNTKDFKLYSVYNSTLHLIKIWNLKSKWEISRFSNPEYREIYFDVLQNLHVNLVHIRHLFKHSFDIIDLCELFSVPIVMSFHDFYFICPTINLINSEGIYCAGKCKDGDSHCKFPTKQIQLNEKNTKEWVKEVWQPNVEKKLNYVSRFITTSNHTKALYCEIYSSLKNRFSVIEHGRDFGYERKYMGKKPSGEKIKILFAGNINYTKGEEYIKKIIKKDKKNRLEMHVIGNITETLKPYVIYHGSYIREDFNKYVEKIGPAYIGILSIWPETYCHVLTEAWSCGMPCIISDIGVLKERGERHGCILADLSDVQKTYDKILEVSSDPAKYDLLCREAMEAKYKTVEEMGELYKTIYDDLS